MQCQSECRSAFKSVVNIRKPFEKTFMNTMKLFMAIPDRINFLQLGRYGCFRNRPTTTFWKTKLSTGLHSTIQSSVNILQAKEKPLPSILPIFPSQADKTPWIGYFWSGCTGEYKRRLEIMGIGVIGIDNHFSKNSFYLLPKPLRLG